MIGVDSRLLTTVVTAKIATTSDSPANPPASSFINSDGSSMENLGAKASISDANLSVVLTAASDNRLLTRSRLSRKGLNQMKQHLASEVEKDDPTKNKLILAYTTFYGLTFYLNLWRTPEAIANLPNLLDTCKYKCTWSTDKSDYDRSDAVVFHLYNVGAGFEGHREFLLSQLPQRVSFDQKWVLMVREPNAFFYPQQLKLLNRYFNLTMTFQTDSDVTIPYGKFWQRSPIKAAEQLKTSPDFLSGRNKMILWLASNCITSSRREEYVRNLQNFIPVDIYGNCGPFKTPGITRVRLMHLDFSREYKFYLAFENSDCDDYVTEKFWHSLLAGMVPIVRGKRVRYDKIAPPNSYIHADNFQTPSDLAQYLIMLSANVTLYKFYHEWRLKYNISSTVFTSNTRWMCDLCRQVHLTPRKFVNVYEHFSEDTRCYTFNRTRDRSKERMQDIENDI
ncbi:3-galactosyl-N-acetylglucosaminide 4-alpha-L-fucosyltransferase FUT3-like [Watersipora subatra]|uniref:3-galactosyl-N-acetylglucosaminide 4-alpha-L-fucosyltransferase FUT3-like n=1 Tax=Watersipora subatra TaxID=2589382 RepID=UPI00355BEDE4